MRTASQPVLQYALIITSVALAVLVVNNSRYKHQLERLERDNMELVKQLDQVHEVPTAALELFARDIQAMKKKGLNNPVAQIIADLKQHRELISYKGTLGGTMNFYDDGKIWILTKKWVLAYFEDGHIAGYLLLEYEVTQGGRIIWKTIASYLA
ncbi:MAG TPA: hypothetical protein VMW24_05470 [Sedimentisphaerales bacterium]|nr:hypothetical protein [Sedimentisphaerales bacterium]